MDAISYTAARTNLAKTMGKVCEDRSPIIIPEQIAIRGNDLAKTTKRCRRPPTFCVHLRMPADYWNPLPNWSTAADRKRNFLNEAHLLRECLGKLSVLAKNRQKGA